MRRRLFNILAVLSLVLCLAVFALWIRSYQVWESYGQYSYDPVRRVSTMHSINSMGGYAFVDWREQEILSDRRAQRMKQDAARGSYSDHWSYVKAVPQNSVFAMASDDFWGRAGFLWYTWHQFPTEEGPVDGFVVSVPHGLLVALLLMPPVAWTVSALRRRRPHRLTARGHCPACAYNLTGNTSGVCPECGTPTAAGMKA